MPRGEREIERCKSHSSISDHFSENFPKIAEESNLQEAQDPTITQPQLTFTLSYSTISTNTIQDFNLHIPYYKQMQW